MTSEALMSKPRWERRFLITQEEKARKTGNWGPWRIKRFPKGSVSSNPKGLAYQFETAHVNSVFSVLDRVLPNGVRHLGVASITGIRPTWPEMQRIKDELAGNDATAVEVYPPHDEIVDQTDMFHIWVMADPLPFTLWEGA